MGSPAPSTRPRHQQQVIKSPAADSLPRESRDRGQEQLPGAIMSPILPMLPTDLRYGRSGGGGGVLSANGQLVTKPTSFLKLGHRRETGTAELSPNRTVAHLVPGPSGTPGREGGGEHRWLLPRLGSLEGRKVNITAVTADALRPSPPRVGPNPGRWRSTPTHPHLTTGCSLNCPTSEPLLTWILCLECCSPYLASQNPAYPHNRNHQLGPFSKPGVDRRLGGDELIQSSRQPSEERRLPPSHR